MAIQDPIADMLTRIRNAQMAKHSDVSMPSSKFKIAVADVLKSEGFISDYVLNGEGYKTEMTISLKYFHGAPVIEKISRVSRAGLRRYFGVKELPKVKAGLGISIVSTSKGVMTDKDARKLGLGGEVICTVE